MNHLLCVKNGGVTGLVLVFGLYALTGVADDSEPVLDNGTNPAVFSTDVELGYNWSQHRAQLANAQINSVELAGRYAFGAQKDYQLFAGIPVQKVSFKAKVPDIDLGHYGFGVGDLTVGLGKRMTYSDSASIVLGALVTLNTAQKEIYDHDTTVGAINAQYVQTRHSQDVWSVGMSHYTKLDGPAYVQVDNSTFDVLWVPKLDHSKNFVTLGAHLLHDWNDGRVHSSLGSRLGRSFGAALGAKNSTLSIEPSMNYDNRNNRLNAAFGVSYQLLGF